MDAKRHNIMRCPYCQHPDSKVIDSRDTDTGIRRRRECLRCESRFTTYERAEVAMPAVVKNPEELARMRVAGRLAAEVLDYIAPFVRPGVTTGRLNDLCHEYTIAHGANSRR